MGGWAISGPWLFLFLPRFCVSLVSVVRLAQQQVSLAHFSNPATESTATGLPCDAFAVWETLALWSPVQLVDVRCLPASHSVLLLWVKHLPICSLDVFLWKKYRPRSTCKKLVVWTGVGVIVGNVCCCVLLCVVAMFRLLTGCFFHIGLCFFTFLLFSSLFRYQEFNGWSHPNLCMSCCKTKNLDTRCWRLGCQRIWKRMGRF